MQKATRWSRSRFQPNLPLGKDGTKITACKEHITLSKDAAKEGMVLLKNDKKVLPLTKGSKVALFGKATIDYVKGGGGSGDVTVSYTRNLYEGFKLYPEHISVLEELADFYKENVKKQYQDGKEPGLTVEPEVPQELWTRAKAYTDTAIISICRFSGEGWDRSDEDFCLTAEETALVQKVKENFAKVIVVLNVGGMVDTSWFVKDDKIQSVLLAWQGGIEGGLAAAELLLGMGNPSGKLTDTFAAKLTDYPSTATFHESDAYVNYIEDIYVGYRYFETIPGAKEKVVYPFGYGLSYTQFELNWGEGYEKDGVIYQHVTVTNTGDYAGKEVVQVYVWAPGWRLQKPVRVLVAFQKTRLLQPGESQRLVLKWELSRMAFYDDLGAISKSAYVLESGIYYFYAGTNVRDAKELKYAYTLGKDTIIEQLSEKMAPTSLPKRMLVDGSFMELTVTEPNDYNASLIERLPLEETDGFAPQTRFREKYHLWTNTPQQKNHFLVEVAEGKITLDEFMAQLSDEDLAWLLGGQPNTGVANVFGIGNIPDYGVPNIMTADGPAGLRILPECGVCTTAWPCATLLACTWNEELVERVGAAGAAEVKENNISMWLTPAINIHRSPLCGRNFEYYSEDPLVAGKLAAAMVRGIQSQHIAATVKHFALNNKEVNRKESDSRASERAIREIYLKAFEIIVKEAQPWAIMTAYNIVNGHRTSECRELLEDILRGEWGYEGMVTSDWWTNGEHYKEMLAGNDVKMAIGFPQQLLKALEQRVITRKDMERCARRILELILKID